MARTTNRLNVERLESRELMAGNVTASIVHIAGKPSLFVTEARFESGQPNLVNITQLNNGSIRVQGLVDANGDRTLINGGLFRDFILPAGVGGLITHLGAGDDRLEVVNVNKFNTMHIGVDHPLVNDADVVNISGVRTRGEVRITTGDGTDTVNVQNTRVGTFLGTQSKDLNINTGAGTDTVLIGAVGGAFNEVRGNLLLNTFRSVAEADTDVVKVFQTVVHKSLFLDTGAGNDTIEMGLVSADDIVVIAGEGQDTASLREVKADDQFFINMATGNDTLDMTFLSANFLSVDGGPGFDKLSTHLPGPTGSKIITGWEVINGLPVFKGFNVGGGGLVLAQ